MGCDGIWEIKTNQENVDFVQQKLKEKETLKSTAEALISSLLAKSA